MGVRLIIVCGLFFSLIVNSAEIPSNLTDWQDWVRYQLEFRNCPQLNGQKLEQKQNFLCAWPATLELDVKQNRLSFSQDWQVVEESKIPLPGDKSLWPQQVTVNQKNAIVLENGNQPYILLPKGQHQIRGQIEWSKQPESLPVSNQVALIKLKLNGKQQRFIDRRANRIWLGREKIEQVKEKDYLKTWVNRLVQDNHPMTMTVAIKLEVGGSGREQKLTQFDLQQYQLKSISSPLNARIDSEGNFLVQLKPGSHQLHLEFKIHGFPEELTFSESGDLWPAQEIWVFQNNERLRSTQIEKASPIDANQGFMPQWANLPHYVLNQKDVFKIKQRHRGITHGSDSLSLSRQMWLSFDNSTYYFFDSIQGLKSKDWRVNTISDYRLTQLSNHGKQRLITYDQQKRTGAEVRTPQIAIQASGEVDSNNMRHASGWDIDFATSQVTLNIPPGRKLLSISGADNSSGDWISRWNLIDLFFVLITLALVFKSFGLVASVFALFTLVLSYHEPNMPMFLWFNLTVALSLAAKIAKPNLLKAINVYKWVSLGLLLLALLPFLAEQIRFTLYPQLEINKTLSSVQVYDTYGFESDRLEEVESSASPAMKRNARISQAKEKKITVTGSRIRRSDLDTSYEQGAIIQAGKGKPNWHWQSAHYSWNGPINGADSVKITVLPESVVKLFRIAIIVFSILWLLVTLDKNSGLINQLKKFLSKTSKGAATVAILLLVVTFPFQSKLNASEIPSDKMLTELRNRLYPAPLCLPDCVSNSSANLSVDGDQLKLELIFQSGAKVATLIPSSNDWNIESLSMNGKPLKHVWQNKSGSWISLAKGQTVVVLSAELKNKSDLTIRFLERPMKLDHQLKGWELSGVSSGRLVSDSIQLTRDAKSLAANSLIAQKNGQPVAQEQSIEDLLFVTRNFTFATQWNMDTSVVRQAPQQGVITAEIPLLSFEQPLEMSDKVTDGVMKVVIPRNSQSVSWRSSIKGNSEFELTALEQKSITESWQILVFPNWNIEISGIQAVTPDGANNDDYWVYHYFPRAGEKLNFSLTKPPAVQGASVAISKIDQVHTISKRKTTTQLSIEYRATRAESLLVQIGETELNKVTHDGAIVNLGKVDGAVSIGLKPGKHQLLLEIQNPLEIGFDFKVDEIGLNQPFSNLSTHVSLPSNRWLISASGPGYGPAIVYWGELIFFIFLAFGLSRLPFSPLNYLQWLILGFGMSTFSWPALAFVATWLLANEWRRKNREKFKDFKITVSWLTLVSTVIAVLVLVAAVPYGLLESPDMGVMGNSSYGNTLKWFLDQGDQSLGRVTLYTLPLWAYKGLMLLWATWLSVSLIRWLGWIWNDLADAPFRRKRIERV